MINDKWMDRVRPLYKEAYLLYMRGSLRTKPWGSHQPVLIHVLNTITKGNVLEYGMGWNSTPIMHTICQKQGRKLLSIDYSQEWLDKFIHYKNINHDMFVFDLDKLLNKEYPFFSCKFTVAFIDGSPEQHRQTMIELLKDNVDYFVVHDTEEVAAGFTYPNFSYKYDFSGFKHVLHFDKAQPMTTILSNLDVINPNILYFFKKKK
jgi:hypothetical protein